MIPVLYPSTETTFTNNGLGGLPDAISCVVTEQRNTQGGYYLEMDYPIDGLHYADIAPERIIYAAPFMGATPQPFRISRINRPIDGIVHIEAPHISAQLQKITTSGTFTARSFTGITYDFAEAARDLGQTFPFWFSSDKTFTESQISFPEPTPFMDVLLGAEGSILDTFGGEYEWNGREVILHDQRGVDSGLEIRYGVNMSDIEAETDASELVTAVVPFWKGTVNDADVVVMGDMCTADNASAYAYVRCVPLDVTEQFELEQDQQPTTAQVTAKGTAFINSTGRKQLQMSIRVSYEPTTNGIGERLINLCDTVRVVYPDLGVSSISKVVETRFNVLAEQYAELTIGSIRNNIVDTIAGLISGGTITGGGGSSGGGGGSTAVTSVNGKTGAVVLNATDVGAMPNTYTAPVTSVNGMTGDVVVSGGGSGDVVSVNGQTGVVVLDAEDVGALPDDTAIPTKTSDLTNDSGFITSADVPTKTSDLTNDSGFITSADIPAQSVTSVNGQTGAVVLDADDVGALASTTGVVRYDQAQTLTEGQKTQARANIGVSNASDQFNVFFGTNPNSTTVRIVKGNSVQVTGQEIKDQITVSQGGCILVVTDYDVSGHFIVYDLDDYTTSGAVVFYRVADGYRYTITVPLDSNVGTKAKVSLASGGGSVAYDTTQSLTAAQMRTARRNIGMPGYAVPLYYSLYSGQVSAGALYKINVDGTHESSPMTFSELYKLYSDDKCFIFAYEDGGNVYKLKTISTSGLTLNMIDGSTEYLLWMDAGSAGASSTVVGVNKTPVTIGGGGGQTVTDAVLYTEQSLTDSQKAQARTNIGAFPLLISMSYSNDAWSCNKDASWLMSNGINSMLYYQGNRYFVTSFVASGGNTATIYYQKKELDSSNADIDEFKFVVQNNAVTITRMQYTHDTNGLFVIPVSYNGSAYTTTVTAAEILENKNDLAVEYANMHFSLKSSFSSDPNSYYIFYFSCEEPESKVIETEWFRVECNNGAVTITRIAKDIVLVPYYSNSDNDKSLVVRNGALVWDSPVNYYSVTLNANGTVNTKDSSLSWTTISARMSNESYTDYLLVTWGNSLFTAEAVETLSNDDIKFIADVEHDGIQRHMVFTLDGDNILTTTAIETYSLRPVTVWEVADVTQGLIALNTNISSSLAWQLTGLNLSPFKRIKVYAKAGRKTGATAADSSIVPAVIIEMLLDDRAKETVSQNVFIGSAVVQNPNDPNRLGMLTCAVSGDKTKFAVLRATSLYGTAATSNTDTYQYVFKIEGYYD